MRKLEKIFIISLITVLLCFIHITLKCISNPSNYNIVGTTLLGLMVITYITIIFFYWKKLRLKKIYSKK